VARKAVPVRRAAFANCSGTLPNNQINRIRFFTANVVPRPNDPTQAQRQQTYLRALNTIPHLTIHYGQFLTRATSHQGQTSSSSSTLAPDRSYCFLADL